MKTIKVFLLLCFSPCLLISQTFIGLENQICDYYGGSSKIESVYGFQSEGEAENIINAITDIVGLKPNFKIMAAKVPNAAAVIYNRERYILYNTSFIRNMDRMAKNRWTSISILAHED